MARGEAAAETQVKCVECKGERRVILKSNDGGRRRAPCPKCAPK